MRTLKPHVTSGSIDYYECSECGWAYPFPRMAAESESNLLNKEMAEKAFSRHECNKFPRAAKATKRTK
jgi:hypothetical protein